MSEEPTPAFPVLQEGAPELRQMCEPVTDFGAELQKLCDRLHRAAAAISGPTLKCAGLAANQIGELRRVVLIDEGGRTFMVNPVIVQSFGTQRVSDGCFSVERGMKRRYTTRAAEILVTYQDRDGKPRRLRCKGFRAAVIQHEVDHLDGKLFTDLLPGVEP
jgi:peptide deformylase